MISLRWACCPSAVAHAVADPRGSESAEQWHRGRPGPSADCVGGCTPTDCPGAATGRQQTRERGCDGADCGGGGRRAACALCPGAHRSECVTFGDLDLCLRKAVLEQREFSLRTAPQEHPIGRALNCQSPDTTTHDVRHQRHSPWDPIESVRVPLSISIMLVKVPMPSRVMSPLRCR